MPFSPFKAPNLGLVPSASEVIANHLREAIISGQFGEGEPVRQDDIARLFNVSKIPVREALKRLEAEGLVIFQRNKGAVVTSLSEPELAQVFEVRVLLETKIMALAVPNMNDEIIDEAERIYASFVHEENAARWAELNWAFHACLYAPAQRPFMLQLIRSVHDKIERYLRVQMSIHEGKRQANDEHMEILKACRRGDVGECVSIMEQHIVSACQSLFEHLPKSGSR